MIVTGGTIVACGGSNIVEEFSSGSTQCAVLFNLDSTASAGTVFRVLDADGSEILSYTPPCSYSYVEFSAPELAVGETCSIMVGEESTELTLSETAMQIGTSSGMSGFGPEENSESENTESESTGVVSAADLNSNVWIQLGMSCVILAAAILFAVKYRR